MYSLQGIGRSFVIGERAEFVLKNISLEIPDGAFIGIEGPSGSGKTTLLSILGMIDQEFDGEILFKGNAVKSLHADARARVRLVDIGFVFQSCQLLPSLSALENVAIPRWRMTGNRTDALKRAAALLDRFGLADRRNSPVRTLSGGEGQRVAVARALVNDPSVILADEPTAHLNAENATEIARLLCEIHDSGRTVVVVSHDSEVLRHADRVLRLCHGAVETDQLIPPKKDRMT